MNTMPLAARGFFAILLWLLASTSAAAVANRGFEDDHNSDDVPDAWFYIRQPVYDRSGVESAHGLASVRMNAANTAVQWVPIVPGTQYTLGASFRADAWDGLGRLLFQWENATQFIDSRQSPALFVDDTYGRRYFSAHAPHSARELLIVPRSPTQSFWVWADDISLYPENFGNPGFEDSASGQLPWWTVLGDTQVDTSGTQSHTGSTAVRVMDDGQLIQRIAAVVPEKQYFLRIWARGEDASPRLSIHLRWLDEEALELSHSVHELVPGSSYAPHMLPLQAPQKAQLLRVAFSAPSGTVWLDDATMYWVVASPSTFSPNSDALQDTSSISFFLPADETVTARIVSADTTRQRTLLAGGTAPAGVNTLAWDGHWDGGGFSSNETVHAELTIAEQSADPVRLTCPIVVNSAQSYDNPAVVPQGFFPIGFWDLKAWMNSDPERFDQLREIANAFFNLAVAANLAAEHRLELMEAIEPTGMKVILPAAEVVAEINRVQGYHALYEPDVRAWAASLRETFSRYSAFLGYYLRDEPDLRLLEPMSQAVKIFSHLDPQHAPYFALGNTGKEAELSNGINAPVLMFDAYPLGVRSPARPSSFTNFIATHRRISGIARAAAKPFWPFIQAFALEGGHRRPTAQEVRAQAYALLALNAKGLIYFILDSAGDLAGLYDKNHQPTQLLASVATLNAELKDLAPLLLQLSPADATVEVREGEVLAELFVTAQGQRYLIASALETQHPVHARIFIPLPGAQQAFDIRDQVTHSLTQETGGAELDITLPPGDGCVLRIEP